VTSFTLLGPVTVNRDGVVTAPTAGKPRALLALLLVNANRSVSVERIVDELWPNDPPETAAKAVQTYVSQLRTLVGDARLELRGSGYRLTVGESELDADRFKRLVAQAHSELETGGHDRARATLGTALGLWASNALEDVVAPFVAGEAAHLEEMRLEALEALHECELAAGHHTKAAAELERLVELHPHRERLVELAMLALYRAGRQAEALALYRRVRTRLVDELGLEPSRRLRDLEQAVLGRDATLDMSIPSAPPVHTPVAPRHMRLWLVGAAVVLAAAIVGAVYAFSDRGGNHMGSSPTPPVASDPELHAFVAKIEGFVVQSREGRQAIARIVAGTSTCKLPARRALLSLATVERNRQSLLDQLAALTTPSADQALAVVKRLQRAIQLSIASDWRYREWLTGLVGNCSSKRAATSLVPVQAGDRQATAAKQAFVDAFDPLARRFGERTWTAADL
jgi:DNA-binding SARP family transcriptional activator